MRQLAIPTDMLNINPMRNLDINPLIPEKLAKLEWSMDNLDFWENLVVRPKGNTINGKLFTTQKDLDAYLEGLIKKGLTEVNFPVEAAYGAHRITAFISLNLKRKKANKELMPNPVLPIKVIDDTKMLQMMIEENQSTWQHSTPTLVENVQQVYTSIIDIMKDIKAEDFDDHIETLYFFKDAASYKQAKGSRGIGPEIIYRFLGFDTSDKEAMKDAPKEDEIRGPLAVIKGVEKGWFDRKDTYVFPSAGHLRFGLGLIEAIMASDKVPLMIKEDWIEDLFLIFKNDDMQMKTPSVQIVKNAIAKIKAQSPAHPIKYIKELGKKSPVIDVKAELVSLFHSKNIFTDEEATKYAEGFAGFEDIIPEVVKKAVAKRDGKVVPPEPTTPTPATTQTQSGAQVGGGQTPQMPTPGGLGETPPEMPISNACNVLKSHYGSILKFANRIADEYEEVDAGDEELFEGAKEVAEGLFDMLDAVLGREYVIDALDDLIGAYRATEPDAEVEPELDIQPTEPTDPDPTPAPEPVEEAPAKEAPAKEAPAPKAAPKPKKAPKPKPKAKK